MTIERSEQPFDIVERPEHYASHKSGVEAIEVGRYLSADWFNAFKYIFRADHKNGIEDVRKALWYAKDGVNHSIPVHSTEWRWSHQVKLDRIIAAENDTNRREFFMAIRRGAGGAALDYVKRILETWPS